MSLLEATLRRERRYWHRTALAEGLPKSSLEGIDQAVALMILLGGADTALDARKIIATVPRFRSEPVDTRERVLRLLRAFYPNSGGVEPMRPDALGERLVANEIAKDDELLDISLGKNSDRRWRKNALVVLNRLARQAPADVLWLRQGLKRHFAENVEPALSVAIESGDPIGRIVEEVLRGSPVSMQKHLAEKLRRILPTETIALSECALAVAEIRFRQLLSGGEAKGYKQKNRLTEAHFDFAHRLGVLGRHGDALKIMLNCKPLVEELAKQGGGRQSC